MCGAMRLSPTFSYEPPVVSKFTNHHNVPQRTEVWLTPPEIIKALGPFDLDPCAATDAPWPTAKEHYAAADDGLLRERSGLAWVNPPYNDVARWVERSRQHGNAIVLTFARVETRWFFRDVWGGATAILFFRGRLRFCHAGGQPARFTSGAPSCLIGFGLTAASRIAASGLSGFIVRP